MSENLRIARAAAHSVLAGALVATLGAFAAAILNVPVRGLVLALGFLIAAPLMFLVATGRGAR